MMFKMIEEVGIWAWCKDKGSSEGTELILKKLKNSTEEIHM